MNERGFIDFRSDTVSHPTAEMRRVMFEAEVGDDVYGDDPLTNELERVAAEILGKEAALFVPSGTMANQLGVLVHTQRGQEIILGSKAHIFVHEVGGAAVLSGVSMKTLDFAGDLPEPAKIEAAIRADDIHEPETSLICLENALSNGRVIPLSIMQEVYELAKARHLAVHLDGARIFNAASFLDLDVKEITKYADTVNVCLSKGLCAPVGSIFAGPADLVKRARKWRKLLGGGMRQTGILAAPALLALQEMPQRLPEDHANAAYLADKLSRIDSVTVLTERRDINMVFFRIKGDAELLKQLPELLAADKILINGQESNGEWRWVTHKDVDRSDIDRAVKKFSELV
ncbi:MAG: low-specificity L-threonine aldolase [Clostridiaceae bacterium]|nr:low-specificity L-threonine aldolase [Clostridiaceae bacterium]